MLRIWLIIRLRVRDETVSVMVSDRQVQNMTIGFEADDYRRLCALARTQDRSLSWLVGRTLRAFLDEHAVAEQLPMPEKVMLLHLSSPVSCTLHQPEYTPGLTNAERSFNGAAFS